MSAPLCQVGQCVRPAVRWKLTTCEHHYYRMRKYGTFADPEPEPGRECGVEECRSVATRLKRTLCETHYYRQYRTGTTDLRPRQTKRGPVMPDPRRKRGPCVIAGCDHIDCGPHGMCAKHKARVDRHGDPHVRIEHADRNLARGDRSAHWTGDEATYHAMHQRVRKERGRAVDFACVDCGRRARQWSYSRINGHGHRDCDIGPYSVDTTDYDPRCVSCHKKFDLAHLGKAIINTKENNHA